MRKITVDEVWSYKPCDRRPGERYCMTNLKALFGDGKTALEICQEFPPRGISILNIFWLIFRREIIPERELHLLACDFAEHILSIWESKYPDDPRLKNLIRIRRSWIKGEATDEELRVARVAAQAVAWGTTWDAAEDGRAVAWDAMVAAQIAARDAAFSQWDTTWVAANAVEIKEQEWQLQKVISLLERTK